VIGANVTMPLGTIDIQSVSDGTVTVDISQLWSDKDGSMSVAVAYYGSTNTNEFDSRNKVGYNVTKTYTAQCFKGYAEFSIYAYASGNAPESECEASAQSIVGLEGVVVYQVEIPCSPCECEPVAELLSQVGASISLPASVFDITAQNVSTVEFSISQNWKSLSMFAVQYYTSDVSPSCDVMGTVPDSEAVFTAQCFKGFAEVNLFVYAGDYVAASDCEACAVPGEDSIDMVVYTFELPCRPCDWSTSAPTPAPTDCYDQTVQLVETIGENMELPPGTVDIQSVNNGDSVTFDIAQLWSDENGSMSMGVYYYTESGAPKLDLSNNVDYNVTKSYTAQCFLGYATFSIYAYVGDDAPESECDALSQPISADTVIYRFEVPCSSCDECEAEANLVQQAGANLSLPAEVVDITAQNVDTVDFDISQLWKSVVSSDDSVKMLAVHYYTTDSVPVCEQMGTSYNAVESFSAQCFKGFAEVRIYVYAGSYAPDDCEACSAPGGEDSVVYSFELPCRPCDWSADAPTPAPQVNALDCNSVAVLSSANGTSCPSSVDMPIDIVDTDGQSVTFALRQTFSTSVQQSVAVRYSHFPYSGDDPDSDYCTKFYDVGSGLFGADFKALCNADGVADVWIYTDSDSSTISCAYDGNNCGYHYEIPCNCPSSRKRGLDELEAFKSPAVNEPSVYDEDIPYCVSEDFPCEGEGSDLVFVCHYSARKGYQTFCIPETDSDILRFYPNDYCGSCEGGYGGLWN
jgi:hypothetical protein